MTDNEHDTDDVGEPAAQPHEHFENDLLKAQEGKGYGEDEGERGDAIDDDEQ